MATSKEKREEKGVKAETAMDEATLRFDFRASTPATQRPEAGTARSNDGSSWKSSVLGLKNMTGRATSKDG